MRGYSDTRYRYSGSSTNWSSRGSVDSLPEFPDPGGDLTVANVRQTDRAMMPRLARVVDFCDLRRQADHGNVAFRFEEEWK